MAVLALPARRRTRVQRVGTVARTVSPRRHAVDCAGRAIGAPPPRQPRRLPHSVRRVGMAGQASHRISVVGHARLGGIVQRDLIHQGSVRADPPPITVPGAPRDPVPSVRATTPRGERRRRIRVKRSAPLAFIARQVRDSVAPLVPTALVRACPRRRVQGGVALGITVRRSLRLIIHVGVV
jgi:hypothetical protein